MAVRVTRSEPIASIRFHRSLKFKTDGDLTDGRCLFAVLNPKPFRTTAEVASDRIEAKAHHTRHV